MKRYIAFVLLLAASCQLWAAHVNQQKAKRVAMTAVGNQQLVLQPSEQFPNLYIFSGANCFAIVSADDCARPLLAYSTEFPFKTENMPENVQGWLASLNAEIQYAIDMKLEATDEIHHEWELLSQGRMPEPKNRTRVRPLVRTRWGQREPYNNMCPDSTAAGCVATAMAQIMNYWEWPDKGVGSYSYEHATYGIISVDFESTFYDWDNMLDEVSLESPEEQQTAVATLMYHCGVSVDMNYSPSGSGAHGTKVKTALASYFKYDPSDMQQLYASDYTNAAWVSLLKSELDNGRPVIYSGYTQSSSGHSFICDGYDAYDYFHFNFGWAGDCNGYYAYGAIAPLGSPASAYSYTNSIISGIRPQESQVAAPENLTASVSDRTVTLHWNPIPDASHYKVYRNGNLINANVTTASYSDSNVAYGNHTYSIRTVKPDGLCSLKSVELLVEVTFSGPVPTNLAANVQDYDVHLDWTAHESENAQLKYGDGTPDYHAYGSTPGEGFYWGQCFTPEQLAPYAGMAVSSVEVYLDTKTNYKMYIYKGEEHELEQIHTQDFTVTSNGWQTINLTTPVVIDYTTNLFVAFYNETHLYVATGVHDDMAGKNARLCSYDGSSWHQMGRSGSWLIRTNITDGTYTYSVYRNKQAIATNVTGTSYVDTGLPDGYYQYSVRTNYYGGLSDPSDVAEAIVGSVGLVSVSTNPPESGNITGCGYYVIGNTATLSASPNVGYLFDRWTENGVQVSVSDTISFVVNGDRQLVAEFKDNDLVVDDVLVTKPTCNGGDNGSVTVVVSGGVAPYVFELEDQVSPTSGNTYTFYDLSAGLYSLKVTDSTGFEIVTNVELGEPAVLTVGEISSGSEIIMAGENASTILSIRDATSGQGSVTYRWKQNGTVISNSNTAQYTPTNLQLGTYSFIREVKDACTGWTRSSGTWKVVVSQTGVDENNASRMEVYPNPTSGKIHFVLSENATRCQIIGLMGNVLQETTPSSPDFDLDLSGLPSGMYLVKVQMSDGRMAFRKVVKR